MKTIPSSWSTSPLAVKLAASSMLLTSTTTTTMTTMVIATTTPRRRRRRRGRRRRRKWRQTSTFWLKEEMLFKKVYTHTHTHMRARGYTLTHSHTYTLTHSRTWFAPSVSLESISGVNCAHMNARVFPRYFHDNWRILLPSLLSSSSSSSALLYSPPPDAVIDLTCFISSLFFFLVLSVDGRFCGHFCHPLFILIGWLIWFRFFFAFFLIFFVWFVLFCWIVAPGLKSNQMDSNRFPVWWRPQKKRKRKVWPVNVITGPAYFSSSRFCQPVWPICGHSDQMETV